MSTITPNKARTLRRAMRAQFADARVKIAEARRLRATGRVLDREDADALLVDMTWDKAGAERCIRELRASTVEKWSAISPSAADRMRARYG